MKGTKGLDREYRSHLTNFPNNLLQDPISKYRQSKNEPLPEGFDHAAWRSKHWTFATENVPKWTAAVKAKYGNAGTRYAATGYCFGAPFVCDLLAQGGPEAQLSAGAFAHPTALKEEHFANLTRVSLARSPSSSRRENHEET